VHVGQTTSAEVPEITEIFQILRGVVLTGRLVDPHGVEVGNSGEILGLVTVTADNATTVSEHADNAAMLPMGGTVFIGEFENAQQVVTNIDRNLILEVSFVFVP
jgi:hypothetical protein